MDSKNIMAQAMMMREKVAEANRALGDARVHGRDATGSVTVEMSGKYDLISMKIDPVFAAKNPDKIADAVLTAYNDAKTRADDLIDDVMGAATAGMPI